MKSMMKKNTFREIKNTLGRFMAILSIIALGVGFFTGVRITTPAMVNIFDEYIAENELYDYRLISTLGWEEEDVESFRNKPDVKYAEGSCSFDVLYTVDNEETVVLKTHSITKDINKLVLQEGRMPLSENECIADYRSWMKVGDRLLISEETPEDTRDSFKVKEYTVVGTADTPYYINFERGTTSLGTGSVSGFIYVPEESLDTDYYTELFIKFDHSYSIYSDEYKDYIESKNAVWEELTQTQAESRYSRILDDAEKELNDGKAELDEKRKEGEQELNDAKSELEKAEKEISDAETELSDAEKKIADGQAELNKAKKELDDAKEKLDDAKKQLDDGQDELDKAEEQLELSKSLLDSSESQLLEGQNQLEEGRRQLLSAWNQIYSAEEEMRSQENELILQEENFNSQYGYLIPMIDYLPDEQRIMIETAQNQISEGKRQIEAAKLQLKESRNTLLNQQNQFNKKYDELAAAWDEFNDGKEQYKKGFKQYQDSLDEFNKGKAEYEEGLKEFENGQKEYEDGVKELEEGKSEYEDGLKEFNDGKKEYEEGLEDYQEGIKEFNEKIADAEEEIADAEKEISDLEKPDTFVLGRDTNIGYACFENDSEIVAQVARVFPIFFILVAALVCMTTMSRMVEEQRTQIGVLKALGYSELSIMGKFMFYSGSAALAGCIIGYAGGTWIFPKVIWMTYKLMYIPLDIGYLFDIKLALLSMTASVLCSLGTTYASCRIELSETAANLMRPKSPKAGKRIFLEMVPFIWNRLKFLHKVSIRNIFRYKGRFFMMILGIGGCTALLLTGFGIKDSIAGFADVQYGEIQTADISISFKSDNNGEIPKELISSLDEKSEAYIFTNNGSWDMLYGTKTKSISLVAPENFDIMDKFMNFRDMKGNTLEYPEMNEALICHSLSERYNVKKGDEIILRNEDMKELHLKVTGIFENHVYNYVFISSDTLSEQLNEKTEFNGAYINFPNNTDVYEASVDIAGLSDVTNCNIFDETRTRMGNMMSSLNYIVLLIIVCAAGLAFIVIYNLTNINITERIREIATIKVLGFFRRETSAYVLRENLALTGIGVLVGLILGILLHKFVMAQIIVDMVDFKGRILPMSFIFSIVLTFIFNFFVNLFMEVKLEKINMAESLKSVD